MEGLCVVIVGGGAGLGQLLADMAVESGAAGIGVIDVNGEAAEAALASGRPAGLKTASAAGDIRTADATHATFTCVADQLGHVDTQSAISILDGASLPW